MIEGLTLLGYAIDNDPKIQQTLVLFLSALSAVDAYQEYKIHKAEPSPKGRDMMKSAVPSVEFIITSLLYLAQFAKKGGAVYGKELAEIMLRVWGMCLTGRSILDIRIHKDYSRIPSGIAGFVVGLMPTCSTLKQVSLGVSGGCSFIRSFFPSR
jgi:hypothetical protein